jgi:hypothetical protein
MYTDCTFLNRLLALSRNERNGVTWVRRLRQPNAAKAHINEMRIFHADER